ncbi:hypothetical protein V2J56_07355 [Georgenia sp. MJ206]|uniref:hypothetical protein n=1 Tax=Georgenia wangjunii TaxID=3117730 RepID=UPI002F25F7AA
MSGRPRRHRRVVAPPTRVGADDADVSRALAWSEPAAEVASEGAPAAGGTGRGVPPADADERATPSAPVVPDRAAEDTDAAWGQRSADSNDARLLEDKPPHW